MAKKPTKNTPATTSARAAGTQRTAKQKPTMPAIDGGLPDGPHSDIGPFQFHLPLDARESLMRLLAGFDPEESTPPYMRPSWLFLRAVDDIVTLRRRLDAYKTFPAMELREIQTALTAAVNLLDTTTPTARTHLGRAHVGYTRGDISLSVFLGHLRGYTRALDAYIQLRQPAHYPAGGRPAKEHIHNTIAALAIAYQEILGGQPSAAPTSGFSDVVLVLLPFLGEKTTDPRRLIAAALRK